MIITAFRNYNVYNIGFLLLITFLLRMAIGLHPPAAQNSTFPYNLLLDTRINTTLPALIVIVQAILLNRRITQNNTFSTTYYLPALMYAVLASMFCLFLTFIPLPPNTAQFLTICF